MRCHSQALTIKLKQDVPLADIESLIADDNAWVKLVPNTREASVRQLTPVAVTGTMDIPVGPLAQAGDGPAVPGRLHHRRPAAVGCGRTAAAHAAHPAARPEAALPAAHKVRQRPETARFAPEHQHLHEQVSLYACRQCDLARACVAGPGSWAGQIGRCWWVMETWLQRASWGDALKHRKLNAGRFALSGAGHRHRLPVGPERAGAGPGPAARAVGAGRAAARGDRCHQHDAPKKPARWRCVWPRPRPTAPRVSTTTRCCPARRCSC